MKKRVSIIALALVLIFAATSAIAAGSTIKELEYKGFGIIKAELSRNCDWYNDASISLTDANGNALDWIFIGGEEDDFYLRSTEIQDGGQYTLSFTLNGNVQDIDFQCITGVKYRIDASGAAVARNNGDDDCDYCRSRDHDEDYCPERINAADLPQDADSLARYFDIERCDRCNGMGHDDDRCPN